MLQDGGGGESVAFGLRPPPEAAPITPAGEMTLTSGGGWVIDSKLQSIDFWVISYDCSLLLVFLSLL